MPYPEETSIPAHEALLANVRGHGDPDLDHAPAGGVEASAAYKKHLYDISGDSSGSIIEHYLSEPDAQAVRHFMQTARSRGFPNASPIDFRRGLMGDAWKPRGNSGKNWLSLALWYRPEWTGVAYRIGRINTMYGSPEIAVDNEENLRMLRNVPSHVASKALGWGSLPDPEIIHGVIGPNSPLIRFSGFTIAKTLEPQLKERPKFTVWPY
jgi:hypothetical protein